MLGRSVWLRLALGAVLLLVFVWGSAAVAEGAAWSSLTDFLINWRPRLFDLSSNVKKPPTISSLTPTSGPAGTRVVIRGSGFTPTGNVIYTGYGHLVAPSPDGTTLELVIKPTFNIPANFASLKKPEFTHLPLWIYVRNQSGLTVSPLMFALTF